MISTIVSRLVILVFGTLYPAYASYKAVRTKNVKEYVKWMMYWIVFGLFTCAETFTDVFLSWFPFYYEIKIILVLWLLSPATKGSSILYRKFVHPMLSRREQEIDDYIAKAKEQGYHTVLNIGSKGINYASSVIMKTAIQGGGGLVNQLRKSYSLSDLTDDSDVRADTRGIPEHEESDVIDARHHRRRHSPRRSASGSSRVDMYFPEVDVRPAPVLNKGPHVRSIEDVSSGYSSAEPLYVGQPPKLEAREGLIRTASVGGTATRSKTRTSRVTGTTKKTTTATVPEDSEFSDSDSDTVVERVPNLIHISKISRKSSDESDNDFSDTIGFPAEAPQSRLSSETIEISSNNKSQTIIAEEIITQQHVSDAGIVDISLQIVLREEEQLEIHSVCNVESIKLAKQLSEDIFEDPVVEDTKSDDSVLEVINKNIETKIISEPITTSDISKEPNEVLPESVDIHLELPKSEETNANNSELEEIYESINFSFCNRGGRYNKLTAPIPPNNQSDEASNTSVVSENIPEIISVTPENDTENTEMVYDNPPSEKSEPTTSETLPIKATLVLKPGVIKNIGPPTENQNKTQIFVSQSPKTKRKHKSKSPISRLMMLPKKIFGHKEESHSASDRKSWHEETRSLTPSSTEDCKSRSDIEGSYEQLVFKSNEDVSKRHEENKMILRNLSHSPNRFRRRAKGQKNEICDDSD